MISFWPHLLGGIGVAHETSAGNHTLAAYSTPEPFLNVNAALGCDATTATQSVLHAKARTVAFGVRVSPLVNELNRAGEIHFMQHEIGDSTDIAATATTVNPVSYGPLQNAASASDSTILTTARIRSSGRIDDRTFCAHLIPDNTMRYQSAAFYGTADGVKAPFKPASCSDTDDQEVFSVMIVNDTTSSASATGNTYRIEWVLVSEVVPSDAYAVTYSVEPSLSDPIVLAKSRNLIASLALEANMARRGATTIGSGSASTSSSGWVNVAGTLADAVGDALNGFSQMSGYRSTAQAVGAGASAYAQYRMAASRQALRMG
jgi:hypothetical protein